MPSKSVFNHPLAAVAYVWALVLVTAFAGLLPALVALLLVETSRRMMPAARRASIAARD